MEVSVEGASVLRDQAVGILRANNATRTYLGMTYYVMPGLGQGEDSKRNMFVMLAPDGSVLWEYQKAHPVPFQV